MAPSIKYLMYILRINALNILSLKFIKQSWNVKLWKCPKARMVPVIQGDLECWICEHTYTHLPMSYRQLEVMKVAMKLDWYDRCDDIPWLHWGTSLALNALLLTHSILQGNFWPPNLIILIDYYCISLFVKCSFDCSLTCCEFYIAIMLRSVKLKDEPENG